jgi:hypothetical protein
VPSTKWRRLGRHYGRASKYSMPLAPSRIELVVAARMVEV